MTIIEAKNILELKDNNINVEEVRRAFIKLSKKYHPDVTRNKDDTMFKKINEAYYLLKQELSLRGNLQSVSKEELKIMLDHLVVSILNAFDKKIYANIVIPELNVWFSNNSPLKTLEKNINMQIELAKPELVNELKSMYDKFSRNIGTKIDGTYRYISNSFNSENISKTLSDSISDIIGLITTTIVAMISGGSGMAMIATGPLGLVLGGALGLYFYSKNKEGIKKKVENYILNNSLPLVAKGFVREKVINKVISGEEEFLSALKNKLEQDLAPIYKELPLIDNYN